MQPVFAKGNSRTTEKLLELRREAQRDKEPRLVLRLQGILMSGRLKRQRDCAAIAGTSQHGAAVD